MKKLFLLSAIAILFAFSFTMAFAGDFNDVADNHWAKQVIERWAKEGIIQGYPDGSYHPENLINRAEYAALVVRLFGPEREADITKFSDVSSKAWYYEDIAKAKALNVIDEFSDSSMLPEAFVSRQDAVVMLNRVLGLKPSEGSAAIETLFYDYEEINPEAAKDIEAFVEAGYLNGYPDHTFKPTKIITRAEAAQILEKAIAMIIREPGEYDLADVRDAVIIRAEGVTLKNTEKAKLIFSNDKVKAATVGVPENVATVVINPENPSNGDNGSTTTTTPTPTPKKTSGGGGGGVVAVATIEITEVEVPSGDNYYTVTRNNVKVRLDQRLTVKVAGEAKVSKYTVKNAVSFVEELAKVVKALDVATVMNTFDRTYPKSEDKDFFALAKLVADALLTDEEYIAFLADEDLDLDRVYASGYSVLVNKFGKTDADIQNATIDILTKAFNNEYEDAEVNEKITATYLIQRLNSLVVE